MKATFTSKDAATLRRLETKMFSGKATRTEAMKAVDLKRKRLVAKAEA